MYSLTKLILLLYVNIIVIPSQNLLAVAISLGQALWQKEFEITHFGQLTALLGRKIWRSLTERNIYVLQTKYMGTIRHRYGSPFRRSGDNIT